MRHQYLREIADQQKGNPAAQVDDDTALRRRNARRAIE
jgi:hypothetical protein